ncbi:MAG: beta-ketoacyl-[acyl-carrier-protein] synthase family protein [Bacteroides sp.]|nr:MAG: beta-ketoacyl-[acyl-carrier-protein] synthase family protein [Bacteroides sp.]
MSNKRVVITGLGTLNPIGDNTKDYWNNLLKCTSGANFITKFNANNCKTKFACEIHNFCPLNLMDRNYVRKTDLFTQYGLSSVIEALKDANIDNNIDKRSIGIVWGSSMGGVTSFKNEVCNYINNKNHVLSPFFIPKTVINSLVGYIIMYYGFNGPGYSISSSCTSSSNAIIDGYRLIQLNEADIVITGGSEAMIDEIGIKAFNSMNLLSKQNEFPSKACKPFSIDRDGFVLGEGAGTIILESLNSAINREAHIYAELIGYSIYSNAINFTMSDYNGETSYKVMLDSIKRSNLKINDINYINAHGTSTILGDASEMKGLKMLLNKSKSTCVSSTKSMTGHLLGASGVIEAIATILSIKNDIVLPTINNDIKDPLTNGINFVFNNPKSYKINYAISNSFGFGGQNTSLVFSKYNTL